MQDMSKGTGVGSTCWARWIISSVTALLPPESGASDKESWGVQAAKY